MVSVNKIATHKFVIVLNEKAPLGKLLSATGQIAMSLYHDADDMTNKNMSFVDTKDPSNQKLIALSDCSFVVTKGKSSQILALFTTCVEKKILTSLFTSTMSYNGVEEDLLMKTASTPLNEVEPYGVGLFGKIEEISALTKKFSIFK